MPVEYNETLWRALYAESGRGDPPAVITYGADWASLEGYAAAFDRRAGWLFNLGIEKNDSVLVIGSAYGYGMQRFYDAGVRVWGIEASPWIWDVENTREWASGLMRSRTAQDWLGSGNEQRTLAEVGAPAAFNWVIDEDAICGQQDWELRAFLSACEGLLIGGSKERIVHLVSALNKVPGDSAINWKTMEDWSAFAPEHLWLSMRTGRSE